VHPADEKGYRYIVVYMCLQIRAVILEPVETLTAGDFLRAVTRAMFRSGSLPTKWYSDRGPEMRSALLREFLTVFEVTRHHGAPMTPREHGEVERTIQTMQRLLSLVMHGVARAFPHEWGACVPLTEFLLYTTPITSSGLTPRDLDRVWSLGTSLERELVQPFVGTEDMDPRSAAKALFSRFRELKGVVERAMTTEAAQRGWMLEMKQRKTERSFKAGDLVYRRRPQRTSEGLRRPAEGPFEVHRVVSRYKVILREVGGGSIVDGGQEIPVDQLLTAAPPYRMAPSAEEHEVRLLQLQLWQTTVPS